MTLLNKIRKKLGYDTTMEKTYELDVYRYTITHTNGNVTNNVKGHLHDRDNGYIVVYEADDTTWAMITTSPYYDLACKPVFRGFCGFDVVKDLGEVEEVEREKIATDTWYISIDTADEEIIDVTKERVMTRE